jgi:hypothetical protein
MDIHTGFDCWANTATIHRTPKSDEVIGVLITTYGPWTATSEGQAVVTLLESAQPGECLPVGLLLLGIGTAKPSQFPVAKGDHWILQPQPLTVRSMLVVATSIDPDPVEPDDHDVAGEGALAMFNLRGEVGAYRLPTVNAPSTEPTDVDEFDSDWMEDQILLVNAMGRRSLGLKARRQAAKASKDNPLPPIRLPDLDFPTISCEDCGGDVDDTGFCDVCDDHTTMPEPFHGAQASPPTAWQCSLLAEIRDAGRQQRRLSDGWREILAYCDIGLPLAKRVASGEVSLSQLDETDQELIGEAWALVRILLDLPTRRFAHLEEALAARRR